MSSVEEPQQLPVEDKPPAEAPPAAEPEEAQPEEAPKEAPKEAAEEQPETQAPAEDGQKAEEEVDEEEKKKEEQEEEEEEKKKQEEEEEERKEDERKRQAAAAALLQEKMLESVKLFDRETGMLRPSVQAVLRHTLKSTRNQLLECQFNEHKRYDELVGILKATVNEHNSYRRFVSVDAEVNFLFRQVFPVKAFSGLSKLTKAVVADTARMVGEFYMEMVRYVDAIAWVDVAMALVGEESTKSKAYGELAFLLGVAMNELQKFGKAAELLQTAREILAGTVEGNIAAAMVSMAKLRAATTIDEQNAALQGAHGHLTEAMKEVGENPNHPFYCMIMEQLALIFSQSGQVQNGMQINEAVFMHIQQNLGDHHPQYARYCRHIGLHLALEANQLKGGIAMLEKSAQLFKELNNKQQYEASMQLIQQVVNMVKRYMQQQQQQQQQQQ